MKQKDIIKKIRKLGYKVTVLNASVSNRGGIPDCMISINGHATFIEIKIDEDKVSKLQNDFLNEFYSSCNVIRYKSEENKFYVTSANYLSFNYESIYELVNKLNNAQ